MFIAGDMLRWNPGQGGAPLWVDVAAPHRQADAMGLGMWLMTTETALPGTPMRCILAGRGREGAPIARVLSAGRPFIGSKPHRVGRSVAARVLPCRKCRQPIACVLSIAFGNLARGLPIKADAMRRGCERLAVAVLSGPPGDGTLDD
jgi:hypothetical protein